MRASLKRFALSLVVGLAPAWSLWDATDAMAQTSTAIVSPASTDDAARQKAEQWLSRAKQAMQEGRFTLAEYCIQSAEKVAGELSGTPLSYTPAHAREELAALRSQNGASGEVQAVVGDTQAAPATAPPAPDAAWLLQARQALAAGDLAAAKSALDKAREAGVQVAHDSVDRIDALIARQNELMQMAKAGDPKDFNYQASLFLLRQADELLAHGDWKTAEGLIFQAKQFPAHYGPTDLTPDQMLAKLNQHRGSAAAAPANLAQAKVEAVKLLSQAQLAFDQNKLDLAKSLTMQAKSMNIPEDQYGKDDLRPWELELKINDAIKLRGTVSPASYDAAPAGAAVVQADYDPAMDTTRNAQVSGQGESQNDETNRGMQMYQSGLAALKNGDASSAKQYFQLAFAYRDQLDAATQQTLQEHLSELAGAAVQEPSSDPITDQEKVVFRKLQSEVLRERSAAEQMLNAKDARGGLRHLNELREQVAKSELSDAAKRPLLVIIDRDIEEMSAYIEAHRAEIENDEMNRMRSQQRAENSQRMTDVDLKIAQLVEEFNKLVDERRFAEAEVTARQAVALAPDKPEVEMLQWKAKFLIRSQLVDNINLEKEDGFVNVMNSVLASSTPFDQDIRYVENWEQLSADRLQSLQNRSATHAEMQILKKLRDQTFQGSFSGEPLSQVVDKIAQLAGLNIVFDRSAVDANAATMEMPVTKNFGSPVSLESLLKLVVADAGLSFVCEDEVVKIVSPEYRKANMFQKQYYVGDLVAPIPDMLAPTYMSFMSPGAAANPVGAANVPGASFTPNGSGIPLTVNPQPGGRVSQSALAQQLPGSPFASGPLGGPLGGLPVVYGSGGPTQYGTPMYNQIAPQLLGGITAADFTDLIQLIQETIEPPSWDEENASIRPFVSTLSLVVRQTQDVHDQIEDLLQQLRDLNDVQIVIEVRFITLQDDFFERVGIDFDFAIEDNTPLQPGTNIPDRPPGSVVVGQTGPRVFNPNFDVGFTQDSFTSAIPQFGGFDAGTAASFGFAILSDIEVFFLLEASKGDQRSNVLQAPVVTVTNGQVASVNDTSNQPFVTSVTPVVGDFAAAQQPIITILPEGSSLNVRATASNDRRYVTLTLVPMFSQITKVDTFTFTGRRIVDQFGSTDNNGGGNGNGNGNGNGGGSGSEDEEDVIIDGTTVQLPTFAITTVQTTVNVPDGGTILMGGIKRLSEGRTERGVPFLSNLPYVNRLFKNVGIGRETSSLMMMVTPRIIIQQEEERRQVGNVGGNFSSN